MIIISYIKTSGTDRALPGEAIILNISILEEDIRKIKIKLSNSLKLILAYNYDLDRKDYLKKEFTFETFKFKFKNNLALKLESEKLDESDYKVFVNIEALDSENEIRDSTIFGIDILKPIIHIDVMKGELPNQLNIELKKEDPTVAAIFKEFEISATNLITNKPARIKIVKYTLKEFIENIDFIPIIFDWKAIFKEIVIYSTNPIILSMNAVYTDILGNKYKTNITEIKLDPVISEVAKKSEKEIIASPIFHTIGFEPALVTA